MYTEISNNVASSSLPLEEALQKLGPQYKFILGPNNKVYNRPSYIGNPFTCSLDNPEEEEFVEKQRELVDSMSGIFSAAFPDANSTYGSPLEVLPFPIGFEPTFLPKNNHSNDKITQVAKEISRTFGARFDAMNDQNVLEVRTPAFQKMSDIGPYFEELFEIVEKYDYTSHIGWRNTGGNHHHVDFRYLTAHSGRTAKRLFLRSIFQDIWNRPYLSWIFQDYSDSSTSCHFSKNSISKFETYAVRNWRGGHFDEVGDGTTALRWQPNNGDYDGTLEFRIFDAVRNVDDILCQARFTQHYLLAIYLQLKLHNHVTYIKDIPNKLENPYEHYSTYRVVDEFYNLIENIRLDISDYRFYINENFLTKISENKKLC